MKFLFLVIIAIIASSINAALILSKLPNSTSTKTAVVVSEFPNRTSSGIVPSNVTVIDGPLSNSNLPVVEPINNPDDASDDASMDEDLDYEDDSEVDDDLDVELVVNRPLFNPDLLTGGKKLFRTKMHDVPFPKLCGGRRKARCCEHGGIFYNDLCEPPLTQLHRRPYSRLEFKNICWSQMKQPLCCFNTFDLVGIGLICRKVR